MLYLSFFFISPFSTLNCSWCRSFPCSWANSFVKYMSAFELCFSFTVASSRPLLSPPGFLEGFLTNLPFHPQQPRDKNPGAPLCAAWLLCLACWCSWRNSVFFAKDTKIGGWQKCALRSPGQVTAHSSAYAKEQSELTSVKPSTQGSKQHGLTSVGCWALNIPCKVGFVTSGLNTDLTLIILCLMHLPIFPHCSCSEIRERSVWQRLRIIAGAVFLFGLK